MNIAILGGTGFIGINLIRALSGEKNRIMVVDVNKQYFATIEKMGLSNVCFVEASFNINTNFDDILEGQDIVYHLVSTTIPSTSNEQISQELMSNIVMTSVMLEACVRKGIKKVVFFSSGGTVYGKNAKCPIKETASTDPINTYGIQKLTIEKLLFVYKYMYGLDYRIIRLANPYGPYQRPNGLLGAVTTFTYKALKNQPITVFGDGSVMRDYIYIQDAVRAILNIVNGNSEEKIFNIGCGRGITIKEVLDTISSVLHKELYVNYQPRREVDVQVNYLDISRYESLYGRLNPISLREGITKTIDFLKRDF